MRGLVGAGPGVAHGLQLLAGRRPVDAARSSRTACRARRGLVCRDASIHGPEEVVADYESVSLKGLEILAAMEGQDFEVPLGDVGTYPASAIPSTFAFEEYVHIRFDLFAPDGPLQGDPPASDELRLAPTLDWIEAALPQQNSSLIDQMDSAVEIRLDGLCGRALLVGRGDVGAHILSDSQAFVRWVTQRGTWEELGVHADGDASALEVVRQLRVI